MYGTALIITVTANSSNNNKMHLHHWNISPLVKFKIHPAH